jgi:hypothetical protein
MSNENELDPLSIQHIAYNAGIMRAQVENIKEDLCMGLMKEALHKVNRLLKFMDTEIVPEFYKSKLLTNKGESDSEKEERSQEIKNTNDIHEPVRDASQDIINA